MLAFKRSELFASVRLLPRKTVDLILPPVCSGCGRAVADADALCARCWSEMRFIAPPLCPVYGTPFTYEMGGGIVSAAALADPPPFARSRSAVIYGDVARRMVHQLKYYDRPHLAEVMAQSMHRAGHELLSKNALLVPVPLYYFRLLKRRFNQSALLARRISSLSGAAHDPLVLQRTRATRQQVGLSAAQREENVRGAFRVPRQMLPRVAGRGIVLVDDVYTSGATVKAATRALLRAGASSVDVLTFARVSH
jgi:ComF family protein